MAHIDIYTKPWCPYCARAKNLLDRKGVRYTEIDLIAEPHREPEMKVRSQQHTVPQIFINSEHIGGSDDLMIADKSGLLDALLFEGHKEKTAI